MAATPTLVDSDVGNTTGTTITGTIDVSGTNRLAFVMVAYKGTQSVSTITFGSDDLGELGSITNTDDGAVEIWYVKQPTPGSGITVTITFSASMGEGAAAWMGSFSGVDQTTPLGTYYSAIEDGSDPHNFTVTAVTNDWVAAAIGQEYGSPTAITSGNTATELYSYDLSNLHTFFAYKVSTAGDFEFSFDCGAGTHTAYNGVAIKGLAATYKLDGVSKNNAGAAEPSVDCYLVKDNGDDTYAYIAYQLSNAVTGAYSFTGLGDNDPAYQVIGWKDGSPNIFDVTDHVLTPVLE